jgi:signal transduction histidine kinase
LDRALSFSLAAGIALLLIVGVIYATANGTQRITSDAVSLHSADEALRSSSVARAQIAIAVHASTVDQQFGSDSSEAIHYALGEADRSLDDFDTALQSLVEEGSANDDLVNRGNHFAVTGAEIVTALRAEQVDQARQLMAEDFADQFTQLVGGLVDRRESLADAVASADTRLGKMGDAAGFLVAVLLPVAVILTHRILARRHARRSALESRLEAERRVSVAREEFIASASHELRTPLTSNTGLAMLLEEHPAITDDESSHELLELIVSESLDLARMVDDLLTSARLDVGALSYSFEDVELSSELREITESMHRVGMSVEVDCQPAHVRADRVRLRQVFRNLLSNASRYGGENIRVEGRKDNRTYVCSVIDDGPGVSQLVADQLFQKFAHKGRDTAQPGSVGLGLSIVQALTQGMGGSVRYERISGETRFIVRLPLTDWAAPEPHRDNNSTVEGTPALVSGRT